MVWWRTVWKLAAVIAICVVLVPLQLLVRGLTQGPASAQIPRWWHAGLRRILGIKVTVDGMAVTDRPTLFVGNHLSHFDIFVLGSLLPASFIAKEDMAHWPIANRLCALQDTVFVSRRPRDAAKMTSRMQAVLQRRRSLVLFPEGTTSDGRAVAPFKSSLFSAFLGHGAGAWTLQPFTLTLLAVDGDPVGVGGKRDAYAFYGDMAMAGHMRHFLGLRGAHLHLVLHPPRQIDQDQDRKQLASGLHAIVAAGIQTPVAACSQQGP